MDIGNRIRELRERKNYSQNHLAEWSEISQSHLRRVERNEANITVTLLMRICKTLEISIGDFFNEPDETDEISSAVAALTTKQKQLLVAFLNSL